jgi:Leucine-rich repeat (LRR) protein
MTNSKYIPVLLLSTTIAFVTCSTNSISKNPTKKAGLDTVYSASTEDLRSNFIPDSVFQMTHLKTLMIFGRDCDRGGPHNDEKTNDGIKCWMIKEIPSSIGDLSNLDTLRLTLGAFGKFPTAISKLQKLRFLDLTDSYMTDIENLTSLKNLNQLWLFGCGLSKLPNDIGNLSNLKFIGLVGNNLDSLELNRIKKLLPNCEIYYH